LYIGQTFKFPPFELHRSMLHLLSMRRSRGQRRRARTHQQEHHLRHRRAFSISFSEMPLDRAQDSTAASPYWATAFLTTQQGTACAGHETSNVATIT
jgi:hypothetical protein